MTWRFWRGWLLLFVLVFFPRGLAAQRGWVLDLSAGRTRHDVLLPRVGTTNMALGTRYTGGNGRWFHASMGAPLLLNFGAGGPFWGITGAGQRITYGHQPWSVGAEVGGDIYAYGGSRFGEYGGGATAQAMPLVGLDLGPLELEARSGVLFNRLVLPGERTNRAVHHSALRVALRPGVGLELVGDGRWMRAPEGSYPYAGASAQWARGRGAAWASAGQWLTDALPRPTISLGIGARLTQRLEVAAEWQQDGGDPLYWNAPRKMWSVRASHAVGRRRATGASFLPEVGGGRVTLRIPLEVSGAAPFVIGDFTGWEPVRMARLDSAWMLTLPLGPGVYHYIYRTAEGTWYLPNSVDHRVPDGMGGWNAVLVVPGEVRR